MASSLISKIKIHKNFPSIDFNAKLSPKSVETQSLFQLVKLKQRRLTSNQIHKQTDINTDPSSGLSKGYPSTENTGVPSESGQGKSSTAQSPSRYQRKRKSISHLQTTQKESKNLAEICQMTPSIDPFEPIRADKALKLDFDNGLTHIDNIKPVTEPFMEGLDLAEKSLNLSLSMIRHELETDQLRTKQEFFEASTVVHNSLELGILDDHPQNRLSEDFGIMEESPIPEGFLKVNVSNIRSGDMMTEDFEHESIKNLLLNDLGLNLSLSAVHSFLEVNFSNSAMRKSFFSQDPNLSAIQNECKSENESSLEVINDLTIRDFSLNVGLSAVEPEYSMNCKSDREALEVLLEF